MSQLVTFATPCIRSLPALERWMTYLVAVLTWWKMSIKKFSFALKLAGSSFTAA